MTVVETHHCVLHEHLEMRCAGAVWSCALHASRFRNAVPPTDEVIAILDAPPLPRFEQLILL